MTRTRYRVFERECPYFLCQELCRHGGTHRRGDGLAMRGQAQAEPDGQCAPRRSLGTRERGNSSCIKPIVPATNTPSIPACHWSSRCASSAARCSVSSSCNGVPIAEINVELIMSSRLIGIVVNTNQRPSSQNVAAPACRPVGPRRSRTSS